MKYRYYQKCKGKEENGLGCVLAFAAMMLAMPVVGLYLFLAGKAAEQKALGAILMIAGLAIWVTRFI